MGGCPCWLPLLPILVQGALSEIHPSAHDRCSNDGMLSCDDVFPHQSGSQHRGTLSALFSQKLRQRHLLLHAHRVSGRTDAVPAFLHGIDDGRHHPQRSDVGDVLRSLQFRAPLSDGRQHVARFALRCHQSSDAQHPESLWHHLSHRHCRADHLPALGCTAREKYPEEDAFLELCGKENEEKERICEIVIGSAIGVIINLVLPKSKKEEV